MSTRRCVTTKRDSKTGYNDSFVTPGGMESDYDDDDFGDTIDEEDDLNDIRNVIGVSPSQFPSEPPPPTQCLNRGSRNLFKDDAFGPNFNDNNFTELQINAFYSAICEENLDAVKKIIESGVPVDIHLRCGWNALMYACNRAADAIVYYLLDKGADANYHKDGFTVLMVTCASTDKSESVRLKCVNYLIQFKADVNAFDKNHLTALMLSARDGKKWIVECLLKNGANTEFLFKNGWSALHWAISSGYSEVVKLLLEANPVLEKVTPDGKSLVEFAKEKDQRRLAKILEKYVQTKTFSLDVEFEEEEKNVGELPSPLQRPFSDTDHRSKLEQYNELDTFLCGLKLNHLRPVFHAQEVTFSQLLLLKDEDLIKMGIEKLGYRLQIMDAIKAIHKKEWEATSLQLARSSDLTCPSTVAIVANISKHLDYIRSTISYLHRAIREDNTILERDQDVNNIHKLIGQLLEASENHQGLKKEIGEFRTYLEQICGKVDFQPVDLIVGEVEKKPKGWLGWWGKASVIGFTGLATVASTSLLLLFRGRK